MGVPQRQMPYLNPLSLSLSTLVKWLGALVEDKLPIEMVSNYYRNFIDNKMKAG